MSKTFTRFFLLVLLFGLNTPEGLSQVPAITSIQGATLHCTPLSAGSPYMVSATNASNYTWSYAGLGGVTLTPNGTMCMVYFPSGNMSATYTLYCYASNSNGSSPVVSFIVNTFETPSVTFSGSQIYCQGSSTQLSASSTIFQASSTTLSYNWSPSTGLSSTNTWSVYANPPASTNYTVLVTNGPCSATNFVMVTFNPCVGLSEFKNDTRALDVFPNPSNGSFVIRSSRNKSATITNELGQTVATVDLSVESDAQITGLPSGIYFVITDETRKKIVVIR